jgi:CheY-like chemotaxis protein
MAFEVLDGEHSRSEDLNSYTGGEAVIEEIAAENLMGIGSALTAAGQWGGPETILLVEDEAFIRKGIAEVLESAGYRLVIARSAADAFEAYRGCSWPLDLLLADIVMPGMSGLELATELQSFHPQARVLLMSGYVEQLAWCELSACGKEYLAKPFSIRMLLKKVREVLDKPIVSEGQAKSRLLCGSAWLAESHRESGIVEQPDQGSPSLHKPEACHRPHYWARPGPR